MPTSAMSHDPTSLHSRFSRNRKSANDMTSFFPHSLFRRMAHHLDLFSTHMSQTLISAVQTIVQTTIPVLLELQSSTIFIRFSISLMVNHSLSHLLISSEHSDPAQGRLDLGSCHCLADTELRHDGLKFPGIRVSVSLSRGLNAIRCSPSHSGSIS